MTATRAAASGCALAPQIVDLLNTIAFSSPSWCDNVRLLDSTPIACGQSRETVKRSQFAAHAAYGYCASHGRYFWGFRLYLPCASDGMPIAFELAAANVPDLSLEHHGATTMPGLITRIAQRLLALAAGPWHNRQVESPAETSPPTTTPTTRNQSADMERCLSSGGRRFGALALVVCCVVGWVGGGPAVAVRDARSG